MLSRTQYSENHYLECVTLENRVPTVANSFQPGWFMNDRETDSTM